MQPFIQLQFKPFPKVPAEKPIPHSEISLKSRFKKMNSEIRFFLVKIGARLAWLKNCFSLSSVFCKFDCHTLGAFLVTLESPNIETHANFLKQFKKLVWECGLRNTYFWCDIEAVAPLKKLVFKLFHLLLIYQTNVFKDLNKLYLWIFSSSLYFLWDNA